MGSHCSKTPKSSQSQHQARFSTDSASHIEKTTEPQEIHEEMSPTTLDFPNIFLGSAEDVRKVYEIDPEVIGKGKFSTVRRAYLPDFRENLRKTTVSHQTFTLKTVLLSSLSAHLHNMLSHELYILKNFPHPLIVKLFEAYKDPKFSHFLLENLEGGDLFTYLCAQPESILKESEAKRLLFGVFSTVQFLHSKGIVHRDLKPENLIFQDKEHKVLKLIDFGLSKDSNINKMLTVVGSPYYVAPEVLQRKGYDKKCDVWSLGVILYLLLQGTPPFFSENVKDLFDIIQEKPVQFKENLNISAEARDLIEKMLRKDPKQRIELADALKHEFFREVREKAAKSSASIEELAWIRERLLEIKENIEELQGNENVFRELLAEYGLQFLNNQQGKSLENAYIFFDRELRGSFSFELFCERVKELGIVWTCAENQEVFTFLAKNEEKHVNYHNFLIGLFESHRTWTEKAKKHVLSKKINRDTVKKFLDRKLIRYSACEIEDLEKQIRKLGEISSEISESDEENVEEIPHFRSSGVKKD